MESPNAVRYLINISQNRSIGDNSFGVAFIMPPDLNLNQVLGDMLFLLLNMLLHPIS